jgi:23S rRNA (cytidine1920-2'-O)/16S rRNA (cytidine1409-2'-O)-methyltransferase
MKDDEKRFVSRGGIKLQAALEAFKIDVGGLVCADLGSNIGGFVDCLLQNGAAKVYSVDTSYGTLAWKLRQDPRVVVMERTNALYVSLPEQVDLVTVDVGWTPQRLILPNAVKMLKPGGRIVTLIKPQYESHEDERVHGVVKPECISVVLERVKADLKRIGIEIERTFESPLLGEGGNKEFFGLVKGPGRIRNSTHEAD